MIQIGDSDEQLEGAKSAEGEEEDEVEEEEEVLEEAEVSELEADETLSAHCCMAEASKEVRTASPGGPGTSLDLCFFVI